MKASIIILAYNHLEDGTKPCIESIYKNTQFEDFELIVVDNNSKDETAAYLKELEKEKSNVKIVLNKTNRGYAGGNNDGLKLAEGDYVILLNNDTLVAPNWLNELLYPFSQDEKIAITSPVTNSAESAQFIDLSVDESNFEQNEFYKNKQGKWFYTDRLVFFCVAIKKEILNTVGILDESYGKGYFEDDDYCQRCLKTGFSLVIAEGSFVYHKGSLTFKNIQGEEFDELMLLNRKKFMKKHNKYSVYSDNVRTVFEKIKSDIENNDLLSVKSRLAMLDMHLSRAQEYEAFMTKKYTNGLVKVLFRVIRENTPFLRKLNNKIRKLFK